MTVAGVGFAINAQDAIVMATADTIASSLPREVRQRLRLLRAALITFTPMFPTTGKRRVPHVRDRPAPTGTGDWTNKRMHFRHPPDWGVPAGTPLAFGRPLTQRRMGSPRRGYIQLPLKDSWCEERGIILQTCYGSTSRCCQQQVVVVDAQRLHGLG